MLVVLIPPVGTGQLGSVMVGDVGIGLHNDQFIACQTCDVVQVAQAAVAAHHSCGLLELYESLLRKHDNENDMTRKQKFIGTRKCDSEASTSYSNATKDLEGSTKDASSRNTQRTKYSKNINGHERCKDDHNKQRGDRSDVVEPRSYRDVVVNGNTSVMT